MNYNEDVKVILGDINKKNIVEVFHISNLDSIKFQDELNNSIKQLQDDNQEIEIQYSTNYTDVSEFPMIYSALIIGRK